MTSGSAFLTLDFWSLALLAGVFVGGFLFVVLITYRRGNRRAQRVLGWLNLVLALTLAEYLLIRAGYFFYDDHFQIVFVTTPLTFLCGPLYYFYATALADKTLALKPRHLLHFIPALLAFINFIPAYLRFESAPSANVGGLFASSYFLVWISGYVYLGLQLVQMGIYIWLANRIAQKLESETQKQASHSGLIYWQWMKKLTIAVAGIWGLHALCLLLMVVSAQHMVEIEYVLALSLSLVICFFGHVTITKPEIFTAASFSNGAVKYQHSSLPPERAQACLEKLLRFMATEKPYLHSDLKLPDLAKRLSLSTNHLSQLLNQQLQRNFFDFVNDYRVREAQQRLVDPRCRHLTHLAIALDAGFSNKNSFNRVFKKHTGMTPSAYAKKRQQVN